MSNKIVEKYIVKLLKNKGINVNIEDVLVYDNKLSCDGYFEFRVDGLVKVHKNDLEYIKLD